MVKTAYLDEQLKQVITVIRKMEPVHSIYLIGTKNRISQVKYFLESEANTKENQSFTYTLLVVSHNFISDPKRFMNEVFNKTREQCEIFSIHYTFNEVKRKLTEGDNFLSLIIRDSKTIYQQTDELKYLPQNHLYHPVVFKQIKTEWEVRFKRAMYFEEKVDVTEHVAERNARHLLLQQSLKQACLGLLYVFWEFRPTYFSLSFLLHLCHQFTSIPEITFPKRSFRSHRIYSDLCHASYNLNNKSEVDTDVEETYKAQNLCYKFLKNAKTIATKKLAELERLHEERNVAKKKYLKK